MPQTRLPGLDRLRGLAIALMMIDHALVACSTLGVEGDWLLLTRLTLTRFAMPAFLVISGFLWSSRLPSRRRLIEVAVAALALNTALAVLWPEFSTPEILVLWVACALGAKVITRYPVLTIVCAYVQFEYWRLPWDAYQPGLVLLFLAVGSLAARAGVTLGTGQFVEILPGFLAAMGRRPLTWYLGHLGMLAVFVSLVG